MSKPRRSIKLTAAQRTQQTQALDRLATWLAPLAGVWPSLRPAQRAAVLAHSPVLARLLALTEVFRGGN